jgi:hypothetical protein
MKGPLHVVCSRDTSLSARITRTLPLFYSEGANEEMDRPAHVRAGHRCCLLALALLLLFRMMPIYSLDRLGHDASFQCCFAC